MRIGATIFISVIVAFVLIFLVVNITQRQKESKYQYMNRDTIKPLEPDSSKWANNYPRQYDSFMKTKENGRIQDLLEATPELVILWAGYGFAIDYNAPRGHSYMLESLRGSLRTGAPMKASDGPMPGTCWTCKSSDVPRIIEEHGAGEFYKETWAYWGKEINNPVGCADCHDSKTMKLTLTRPALKEALAKEGKDIKDITHQEMRSLVCAQCHVEYYFGEEKYLIFPWTEGLAVESVEEYAKKHNVVDWKHQLSRAPMLKAQHPDYELYKTGVHAEKGLACADCHMPYVTEGGQKFSSHHIQNPLNSISSTCQTCHRESEANIRNMVAKRKGKVAEILNKLTSLLVKAHLETEYAWKSGAMEEQMEDILQGIRIAQWRWDYVAGSHGTGFHAPLEASRVIAKGIAQIGETRLQLLQVLNDLGHTSDIPYPDVSTKKKAQEYIGIDLKELKKAKNAFKKEVAAEWDAQ